MDIFKEIDKINETEKRQGSLVDQTKSSEVITEMEKLSYQELKLVQVRLTNLLNKKKPSTPSSNHDDEAPTFNI